MSSIPSVEEEACRMKWGVEGGIGEEGTPVLREMPSIVYHLWLVRWTVNSMSHGTYDHFRTVTR